MIGYDNIDRSSFRVGHYVGYATFKGVSVVYDIRPFTMVRTKMWAATVPYGNAGWDMRAPHLTGANLREISQKLTKITEGN